MARQAEAHIGSPQDVEWAIANEQLYMLQARPITTLREQPIEPVPMKFAIPEGFWESDAEHISKPLTPMGSTVLLPTYTSGVEKMCTATGLLLEKLEYRNIGGWMYVRMVPPGAKDMTPPPPFVMKILLRLVPAMRTRIQRATAFVRLDFTNERFNDVTVAVVDGKGCAKVRQKIRGPFRKPEVEEVSVLQTAAGPLGLTLLKQAGRLFGGPCEVFYAGSVAPPK